MFMLSNVISNVSLRLHLFFIYHYTEQTALYVYWFSNNVVYTTRYACIITDTDEREREDTKKNCTICLLLQN